ncbi:CCA tRNA nucleotidyltransferase [Acidithiobacillus sp.]|uniref:CCA tRNA nucleotidyltransferase n=1 Tax=Acidithiobacillus sp. TaxID=1872118 RepID=UPI0032AF0C58
MTCSVGKKDILQRIETVWPLSRIQSLQVLGEQAAAQGAELYLVGGVVRDLFLARPSEDWDLALDGDLELFLDTLERLGYRLRKRSLFGTASLVDAEGLRWDLAHCRGERYARPGALPEVFPADIHSDLYRRDFRCNAMALALSPESFGTLLDPFGGLHDIDWGILEVLHATSFQDDPTRVLRGLRFSLRFNFSLGTDAKKQLQVLLAADGFANVSGTRLFREIQMLLALPNLAFNLQQMAGWGLATLLPPLQNPPGDLWPALQRLEAALEQYQQAFSESLPQPEAVLLLLAALSPPPLREERWQYWQWRGDKHWQRDLASLPARLPGPDTAAQARYWQKWAPAGILCALALQEEPELTASAWQYLRRWRWQKVPVDGQDLLAWGIAPGPELGSLLTTLQNAVWNGAFDDKDGARRWLKQQNLLP